MMSVGMHRRQHQPTNTNKMLPYKPTNDIDSEYSSSDQFCVTKDKFYVNDEIEDQKKMIGNSYYDRHYERLSRMYQIRGNMRREKGESSDKNYIFQNKASIRNMIGDSNEQKNIIEDLQGYYTYGNDLLSDRGILGQTDFSEYNFHPSIPQAVVKNDLKNNTPSQESDSKRNSTLEGRNSEFECPNNSYSSSSDHQRAPYDLRDPHSSRKDVEIFSKERRDFIDSNFLDSQEHIQRDQAGNLQNLEGNRNSYRSTDPKYEESKKISESQRHLPQSIDTSQYVTDRNENFFAKSQDSYYQKSEPEFSQQQKTGTNERTSSENHKSTDDQRISKFTSVQDYHRYESGVRISPHSSQNTHISNFSQCEPHKIQEHGENKFFQAHEEFKKMSNAQIESLQYSHDPLSSTSKSSFHNSNTNTPKDSAHNTSRPNLQKDGNESKDGAEQRTQIKITNDSEQANTISDFKDSGDQTKNVMKNFVEQAHPEYLVSKNLRFSNFEKGHYVAEQNRKSDQIGHDIVQNHSYAEKNRYSEAYNNPVQNSHHSHGINIQPDPEENFDGFSKFASKFDQRSKSEQINSNYAEDLDFDITTQHNNKTAENNVISHMGRFNGGIHEHETFDARKSYDYGDKLGTQFHQKALFGLDTDSKRTNYATNPTSKSFDHEHSQKSCENQTNNYERQNSNQDSAVYDDPSTRKYDLQSNKQEISKNSMSSREKYEIYDNLGSTFHEKNSPDHSNQSEKSLRIDSKSISLGRFSTQSFAYDSGHNKSSETKKHDIDYKSRGSNYENEDPNNYQMQYSSKFLSTKDVELSHSRDDREQNVDSHEQNKRHYNVSATNDPKFKYYSDSNSSRYPSEYFEDSRSYDCTGRDTSDIQSRDPYQQPYDSYSYSHDKHGNPSAQDWTNQNQSSIPSDFYSKSYYYTNNSSQSLKYAPQSLSNQLYPEGIQNEYYSKSTNSHFQNIYGECSNPDMNQLRSLWKKERNRLAAKKSRDKKATHIKNLESQAKGLLKQNELYNEKVRMYDKLAGECCMIIESLLVRGPMSFDSNIMRFSDLINAFTKNEAFNKINQALGSDSKALITNDRLCNLSNAINSYLSCVLNNPSKPSQN